MSEYIRRAPVFPKVDGEVTPSLQTLTTWGGCTFGSTTGPVTSISATFTIPSLSGQTSSTMSIWAGMGNVVQTGIFCQYNTTKTGNNNILFQGSPWTWWLGGSNSAGSEFWDPAAFPLAVGDVLTLSMSYEPDTYWSVTQTDQTKGWSYTEYKSHQSTGNCLTAWEYPYSQACVVIEDEVGGGNLPNYGSLTFSNVEMTPVINTSLINYITTKNATVEQTPSTFVNNSFTMTWKAYN